MSVHVESWAWRQKVGSPIRKLVLVKLAQNADDDGWSWWRQGRMAEECETTRQTINEHIRALRGMGLIQVEQMPRERGGGRGINRYRIMGPWTSDVENPDSDVKNPDSDVGQADNHLSVRPTTGNRKGESSEDQNLAADAASGPEFLGQRRWRVFSRPGRGPFRVDLATGSCTCENLSKSPCRHLRVAGEAEERANSARRRELREAVWDALVEIFGAPTTRGNADRGMIVTDIAEMLVNDRIEQTPERWKREVDDRYGALARDWGVGKATVHSLHKNWGIAGKLLAEKGRRIVQDVGDGSGEVEAGGYTEYALRQAEKTRLEAGLDGDAG